MIRKITLADREEYLKMADDFYHSGAPIAPVPKKHMEITFDEMMSSDRYVEGYFFEEDGIVKGFALLAKTFSQEAGGIVIWIEELFVKEEYRNNGLVQKFFEFLYETHKDAARFRLETEPDNEDAMRLYYRMGFEDFEYIQFKKGK